MSGFTGEKIAAKERKEHKSFLRNLILVTAIILSVMAMPYHCTICGQEHTELPHIGSAAPFQWADVLAKDPNSLLTGDLCIVEGRGYFVRGIIEIPVHDYEYEFGWGVWVSHKKENFETYREHFDSADIGPFFGWLSTKIDYYPQPTLNLKTMAHYRGGGLRPRIVFVGIGSPAVSSAARWNFIGRRLEDGASLCQRTNHRKLKF